MGQAVPPLVAGHQQDLLHFPKIQISFLFYFFFFFLLMSFSHNLKQVLLFSSESIHQIFKSCLVKLVLISMELLLFL